jgi:hypothetical protein
MSQVLGDFGPPDFTMLRPFLTWGVFLNLWNVYFFNFPFFSGHSKSRLLNQLIGGHDCRFHKFHDKI